MRTATPAVVFRSMSRGSAAGLGLLLMLGGALVGLGGVAGVARAYDRSQLGVASGALWMVLLPAVLALLLAGYRPALSVAVTAGAGVLAVARFLSDLNLVTSTNTVIRPEFFYELTDRAQPFSAAPGGIAVLLGDLVMLTAGVLAARRLSNGLSFRSERIFDAVPVEPEANSSGPELLAEALESSDSVRGTDLGEELFGEGTGPSERNNWLIFAGFVGVLGILIASLGLPYEGGYLADRYIPAGIDLLGIAAALVAALVGIVAVLASGTLPRQIALALLGGVAIGAAVPFLTAIAVRAGGAPVQVNPTVGLGLLGAVVLAAAGLLSRVKLAPQDVDDPSPRSLRTSNIVGAVLTLLVAAAGFAAWRLPQLDFNGGVVPAAASTADISTPQAAPFLAAAIIPLVGGLLWLVPRTRRAGRAIASVGWIAMIFAVAQSLYILGLLVNSASVPNAGFALPRWSGGPGLWLGVLGIALGVAVLAVSWTASRAAADSSALVADEDSLAAARRVGAFPAIVMTVVAVVALALPVYRTGQWTSATLLVGYQVNSWGVLALAAGVIAAAWLGARATSVSAAVAFALAGAALLSVRLVIPAAVRAQDGFEVRAGLVAGYVAVAVFLVGGVLLALSASRIRMTDPTVTSGRPQGTDRRPTAKARPVAGAGKGSGEPKRPTSAPRRK